MPKKSKPLTIKSNLALPTKLQPFERALFGPMLTEIFHEIIADAPTDSVPQPDWERDRRFVAACRRLGVAIERRRDEPDGSVVFTCRLPPK